MQAALSGEEGAGGCSDGGFVAIDCWFGEEEEVVKVVEEA